MIIVIVQILRIPNKYAIIIIVVTIIPHHQNRKQRKIILLKKVRIRWNLLLVIISAPHLFEPLLSSKKPEDGALEKSNGNSRRVEVILSEPRRLLVVEFVAIQFFGGVPSAL